LLTVCLQTEIILKDELEELRRQDAAVSAMRDKERKASELLARQVRHMQELREFEKGIVSRAEDILMSGQDLGSNAKKGLTRSRTASRKFLLPPGGSSIGPVANPVLRVQGSRNILNIESDSDGEEEHGSSDAATPDVAPSRRMLGGGRGFGRSAPNMRQPPSTRPLMKEESIKEEDEAMSRQDSTRSSLTGCESVEEYNEDTKSESGAPTQQEPSADAIPASASVDEKASGLMEKSESQRSMISEDGQSFSSQNSAAKDEVIQGYVKQVNELEQAALESEQRADSKEVESMQLKRQLFELEVKLNEVQRELQRHIELAFEKENEFKRKLKHAENTGEDPRETILTLLQKSAAGRQSMTDTTGMRKDSSGALLASEGGGAAGGVGMLKTGGAAALNALFGGPRPGGLPMPPVQGGGSEAAVAAAATIPVGAPKQDAEEGMRLAVKTSRPPPCPPPLPSGAMHLLQSIEAAKPGGIPLAPPLPGEHAGSAPGEKRDDNSKPKKEVITPKVAMRSLFWNKIPDKMISKTVWEELSDERVQIDIQKLEEQFCKAVVKAQEEGDKKEASADKVDKPKEVTLLDTKVQQNVGIALVKYRMSSHEIRKAIIRMDEKKLDLEKLNSLRALAPTPDDIATLRDFDGDTETLGRVEKFFIQIIDIPRYTQRLDCFIFMRKFQMLLSEVYCELDVLNRAIDQVENSTSFKKVLEIVLAVGNYLNGGTPRGGVYGFKLDGLLKLSTIKSVDNKMSLMDFISSHCEDTDAGVAIIDEELSMAEEASRVGLDTCRSEINALKKNLSNVEEQVKAQQAEQYADPSDQFVAKLHPFWQEASGEMEKLESEYLATTQRFAQVADFFGEDGKKISTEEFFTLLKVFVGGFMKAHRDNEKRRIMQEKSEMKKVSAAATITMAISTMILWVCCNDCLAECRGKEEETSR
jgi:hypothetical protein